MSDERHRSDRWLKVALAGFLALLLLSAATFSACHALHRTLHADESSGQHFCLVCSLVKGLVTAEAFAFVSALLAGCFFLGCRLADYFALPSSDYCLSRCRAPPSALLS